MSEHNKMAYRLVARHVYNLSRVSKKHLLSILQLDEQMQKYQEFEFCVQEISTWPLKNSRTIQERVAPEAHLDDNMLGVLASAPPVD